MDKDIILYTSEQAAHQATVTGWVSRTGYFYGKDEHMARWNGCTHLICECGQIMDKSWTKCKSCRDKKDVERYDKKEKRQWNGNDLLYSEAADKYFMDEDDLLEYCDCYGTTTEKLRLVICEPVFAREISLYDYYSGDLPDDGEINRELQDAFDELNERIRECKQPLSWSPGKFAADLSQKNGVNKIPSHEDIAQVALLIKPICRQGGINRC